MRAADDYPAIRERLAELRQKPVPPGSEPAPALAFSPERGCRGVVRCGDPDYCASMGYCLCHC